jgi:hypothetical protein
VIICAVALVVYAVNLLKFEIQPRNAWGLTYGTLATVLFVGTGLYAVRRRRLSLAARLRLGSSYQWLRFHIYGGLLFMILVCMHTGFKLPSGTLNWWLWLSAIGVTVSGLLGAALQKWIPSVLSSGLATEVVYERIPQLCDEIRDRAEKLVAGGSEPLSDFYRLELSPRLATPARSTLYFLDISGGLASQLRVFEYVRKFLPSEELAKFNELLSLYRAKLELDAHFTLQWVLRGWLYSHLPLSLLLFALVLLHLFAVAYY